ncbi:MAG: acyltransferase family protein, partial [Dehalococcoidia bacterium]|nr:acyltransferase family protein [Dehalococcoidia bacterium]
MVSKRLFIFDFLRLLAILLVVLSHILSMESIDAVRGYLGIMGLGIFFFVSGYLLLSSEKPSTGHNTISFIKKRFVRIYPLYWLALILTILLSWLLENNLFDWRTIAVYFLGLQSVFVPRYMVEISSYWFIGTILIYYLLFPLITFGNKISSILLIGVSVFVFLIVIRVFTGLFDGRVFEYFFVFVLGLMVARSRFFESDYFRKWQIPSAVVSVVCICIVIILGPLMPSDLSQINLSLLFTVGLITVFRIMLIISTIAAIYWI